MDKELERNARLLESLKMKDERLKDDKKGWHIRNPSREEIWMDGWAACETEKGLEQLRNAKD